MGFINNIVITKLLSSHMFVTIKLEKSSQKNFKNLGFSKMSACARPHVRVFYVTETYTQTRFYSRIAQFALPKILL